jgi:hypothetical protein
MENQEFVEEFALIDTNPYDVPQVMNRRTAGAVKG